jgi:hypothetical protein
MDLQHTQLSIGAEKPFKLLHVSDSHLCFANERDDMRKQQLAARRAHEFEGDTPGCCLHYFKESCRFANEQGAILTHTGDLFDFVSEAHCEMAPELLSLPNDVFMAVGNHEFSLYVGEAFEDEKYKAISFDRVQAAFPGWDLRFASRVVNGVNLIAIDNVYYDFSQYALDCLKAEAEKGLPMLVFFHTPIYTPEFYEKSISRSTSAYLVGTPIEKMQNYTDYRFRQQICTPQTQKFLDYFLKLDLVKAVFAGHLHFSFEAPLANGVMQYVTGAQYKNIARLVTVE